MKKSKFTETQIIAVLKQGDAGVPVKDLCRQARISPATYCLRLDDDQLSNGPRTYTDQTWPPIRLALRTDTVVA
jgi:putative transposase